MTLVPPPTTTVPADQLGAVHFVGIGGAGMSGIARIMLARGMTVSGSDAKDSVALSALRALGARVAVGHDGANLGDADTVVVSTAIGAANPELVAAQDRGLLVLPRAAALASTMVGRRSVAVAGTHGKTTTTSMLTVALQSAGADPSFAIGGTLNDSGANAHHGTGDLFVAEADESDGSLLLYSPVVSVVTNVEADHLDHYGTLDAVEAAFLDFARRLLPSGTLVVCADDDGSRRLGERARAEGVGVSSYGESPEADLELRGLTTSAGGSEADVVWEGEPVGRLRLHVPGAHNALDAAAALTVGIRLGLPAEALLRGLEGFSGTRRRFERKGEAGGVTVYDDYAHHPTELRATLRAARGVAGEGRLVVVFQPHRYSRTAAFLPDFGEALGLADEVVVMDVYAAGEDPIPGATGAAVAAAVPPGVPTLFESSWSAVAAALAARTRPGDVVLTLGAGDVTMVGPEVLEELARLRPEASRA